MRLKHKPWHAEVPTELREWVDHRRAVAHLRMVRHCVSGIATGLLSIFAALFLSGSLNGAIATGFFVLTLTCIATIVHRLALARSRRGGMAPRRLIRVLTVSYLCDSIAFGVAAAVALPWLPPTIQMLVVLVLITLCMGTGYLMRTVPGPAFALLIPIALGLLVGVGRLGTPAAYAIIYTATGAFGLTVSQVLTLHALFVNRILRDRRLEENNRTIKLLLNDFEESGSDWLFQLDGDGRMMSVGKRFGQAAGRCPTAMEGADFLELFAAGQATDILRQHIASHRPIRNQVVPFVAPEGVSENPSWWSISGRPCRVATPGAVAFRGVVSDITVQRHAEARVRQMALFDGLTSLPNRTQFNAVLAEMLENRRTGSGIALLMIDVDHFKTVNDMNGHVVGDAFLRLIAARLAETVEISGLGGEAALVARLGGDEFAILMRSDDIGPRAERLGTALVAAIAAPADLDGLAFEPNVSIGIAFAPEHGDAAQPLLNSADIALYAAKARGRGCWAMFEEGMDIQVHERHILTRDLRHAVSRGELRLFLQPLIDLDTEARIGYEALLRWEHPLRGLVMPDRFIPLAEETGLIVGIGEWVIRTAIAEAASWDGGTTISINLSPVQLSSPNLLPVVINALAETGLDPALVEFEITESVLLHNSDANIQVLNRLHDLGLKVALDDFGTGFASLNYLLTFPFDTIKIDRSFIADIDSRAESGAIVSAVIGLANSLGMRTLAEGVEDEAQLARLKQHGCRMVQGWLFGKAMPSEHYQPHDESIRAISAVPAPVPLVEVLTERAVAGPRPQRRAIG